MTTDAARAAAVAHSIELVEENTTIGLGSGRAIFALAEAIGERWGGNPPIRAVTASEETAARATRAGITLMPLEKTTVLDVLFDGADEIDPQLRLIKGRGAALLREKLVANATQRMVILAENTKRVSRLGEQQDVPVEIVRFAWEQTQRRLEEIAGSAPQRLNDEGNPVITDEGNLLVDVPLGADADVLEFAGTLKATVGVIEHGLFLTEATEAILGKADGSTLRLDRQAR